MTTRLAYILGAKGSGVLVQFCAHDDPDAEFEPDGLPYWIGGYPSAEFIEPVEVWPPITVVNADNPSQTRDMPAPLQSGLAFITWNAFFKPRPAQYERALQDKRPFRPRRKTLEANKRSREKKKVKKSTQYRLL